MELDHDPPHQGATIAIIWVPEAQATFGTGTPLRGNSRLRGRVEG